MWWVTVTKPKLLNGEWFVEVAVELVMSVSQSRWMSSRGRRLPHISYNCLTINALPFPTTYYNLFSPLALRQLESSTVGDRLSFHDLSKQTIDIPICLKWYNLCIYCWLALLASWNQTKTTTVVGMVPVEHRHGNKQPSEQLEVSLSK